MPEPGLPSGERVRTQTANLLALSATAADVRRVLTESGLFDARKTDELAAVLSEHWRRARPLGVCTATVVLWSRQETPLMRISVVEAKNLQMRYFILQGALGLGAKRGTERVVTEAALLRTLGPLGIGMVPVEASLEPAQVRIAAERLAADTHYAIELEGCRDVTSTGDARGGNHMIGVCLQQGRAYLLDPNYGVWCYEPVFGGASPLARLARDLEYLCTAEYNPQRVSMSRLSRIPPRRPAPPPGPPPLRPESAAAAAAAAARSTASIASMTASAAAAAAGTSAGSTADTDPLMALLLTFND